MLAYATGIITNTNPNCTLSAFETQTRWGKKGGGIRQSIEREKW
jgi:phosphoserine aminotransferase